MSLSHERRSVRWRKERPECWTRGKARPAGSVICLHGCAHNPTGVDPTKEQWSAIAGAVEANELVPFFDVAYQGFASGSLEEDAYAPRLFESRGIEFFCAQSYSKNLGLYAERIGAINAVVNDKETAEKTLSQVRVFLSLFAYCMGNWYDVVFCVHR